jgi:hypothetical protein
MPHKDNPIYPNLDTHEGHGLVSDLATTLLCFSTCVGGPYFDWTGHSIVTDHPQTLWTTWARFQAPWKVVQCVQHNLEDLPA